MTFEEYWDKHYVGRNEAFKGHIKMAWDAAVFEAAKVADDMQYEADGYPACLYNELIGTAILELKS